MPCMPVLGNSDHSSWSQLAWAYPALWLVWRHSAGMLWRNKWDHQVQYFQMTDAMTTMGMWQCVLWYDPSWISMPLCCLSCCMILKPDLKGNTNCPKVFHTSCLKFCVTTRNAMAARKQGGRSLDFPDAKHWSLEALYLTLRNNVQCTCCTRVVTETTVVLGYAAVTMCLHSTATRLRHWLTTFLWAKALR